MKLFVSFVDDDDDFVLFESEDVLFDDYFEMTFVVDLDSEEDI